MVPVGIDPTVNGTATDTEPDGYIGDRTPPVEFQETEGTTVGADVVGGLQLSAKAKPLLRCQSHGVHGSPLGQDIPVKPEGARMDISWGYPQIGAKSRKTGDKMGSDRK
jgi:hypothetical protein